MSATFTVPSDEELFASITNIATWLGTHCHTGPQSNPEQISEEDLAIAVPGECLFPELAAGNEDATQHEEKGILVYTDSADEKYVWLRQEWHSVEKVLSITSPKNGWEKTDCLGERLLVLILTQLDYAAREAEAEVPYGCCPLSDLTYLLWVRNRPMGMCSVKCKGTTIWGGEEVYSCDSLDTLYVRPCIRRQGYSLVLLHSLASQLPAGEHLGLSHPVSLSMCKVLLKFIQVYPHLRDSLWTLDEDGEVSGTVTLMLGSLIMLGELQGVSQPITALASDSQQASDSKQQGEQQHQQQQNPQQMSQDPTSSEQEVKMEQS